MILHIMKKDLRLLWKIVVLVAAVQMVFTLMLIHIDHSATAKNPYGLLLQLILFMALLGRAVLTVMCVQLDAIPGVHQDWLTRPVSRRDLLLAKIFFVMLFVQGPVFLFDGLQALSNGAPLTLAFTTALTRTMFITAILTLPFLAFGSLTENLTQAIAGAVVFFLVLAGAQMLFVGLNEGRRILEVSPTTLTGLDWMPDAIRLIIACCAVAIVLALQYFRRMTQLSRRVLVLGAFLCLSARLLPWNVAYALQKTIVRSSDTSALMLRFDPSRAPRRDSSGVSKDILQGQFGGTAGDAVVYLPVTIAGLPHDSLLKADRVEASMKVPGGKVFHLGVSGDFQPLPRVEGVADTYSPIFLSNDLYQRYKNVPVDLEVTYSVTEMRVRDSGGINPMQGRKQYSSIGLCTSGLNSAETQINVRCLQPGTIPLCTSATLKRSDSSAANPAVISCAPNYAPVYPVLIPDGTSRFSANLPFRDPNGVGPYPVQGQDLSRSVVDIEVYEAAGHCQRTLSVPGVRLAEWSAQ